MPELPDVAPGEVIASGHINDIAGRSVQRYADASELAALNPTPTQGELAFTEDNNNTSVWTGTAWAPFSSNPDVTLWKTSQTSVLLATAVDSGIDSMVLSIPSNWVTYRLESTMSMSVLDASGGNVGLGNLLSIRVRADAQASGPIFDPGTYLHEVADINYLDASTFSMVHVLDSNTGTGNKAVYLNVWAQPSFAVNRTRYAWKVTAVRT